MNKKIKDYLKNRRNIIIASDWFDNNFFGGFLPSKTEFKDILNEKRFRLNDVQVSSRRINYWMEEGIITDDRPNGKGWRKFSISELLWLEIVMKLIKFGVSFDNIRKVKFYLEFYNEMEKISKFPQLDFYVSLCLTQSMPINLLVFDNGEAVIARRSDIDLWKSLGTIVDDYISIDLNKLVQRSFKNDKYKADYLNYSLSPIEKEVQKAIYFDDIHSLSLKINNKEYYLAKEYLQSSKTEVEAMLNMMDHAETTTIKRGKNKIYILTEKKKIKK